MNTKLAAFVSWLRQPTTILGTVTFAATMWEALQHQIVWGAAAPVLAGAAVAIGWPEQTALSASVQKTVTDAVALGQSKVVNPGALAALTTDLVTTAEMLPPGTPVVVVQHSITPVAPTAAVAAAASSAAPVPALAA